MDRARIIKAAILMIIMVVLCGGYYYYLSSRNSQNNSEKNAQDQATEMTAVQELIARDSYREYPTTPVQVLKYYNEITACFYNESYSEDELSKMATMIRNLFDAELVANQSFENYLSSLKNDIAVFKGGNITIYNCEVTPSTDVEYFEHDGYSCAKLNCVYTLKSGTVYQTTKEVFIMRKDPDGHWKIFGFTLAEE